MNETGLLLMALITGVLLGVFFFGGLWWTTKKAIVSKLPAVWFSVGLIIRLALTLFVFYIVGRNHWVRMLICLVGFIIARMVILRFVQLPKYNKSIRKEVEYENES